MHHGRKVHFQQAANGRRDVHESDQLTHSSAYTLVRHADDQRHADRALVNEITVVSLEVLAQHFPVVTGNDQQRRIVESQLLELANYLSNAIVDVRHLSGIWLLAKPRREGLRGRVRFVRIIVVQKQEATVCLMPIQPLER